VYRLPEFPLMKFMILSWIHEKLYIMNLSWIRVVFMNFIFLCVNRSFSAIFGPKIMNLSWILAFFHEFVMNFGFFFHEFASWILALFFMNLPKTEWEHCIFHWKMPAIYFFGLLLTLLKYLLTALFWCFGYLKK